ncbi:MAG TPA: hypothetical protein PLB48_01645 [Treponema sp.]|nr:hypothetical protein [Treponema sp.]HPC70484.1 hypothetical protein [Treponema sp.]HRS03367.1 hypothetical protein [Treponema sp.]HRU28700.1 hypothetical protein [Treponema sp.]
MSSGVAEYRADRKRLEQSLLISILIWLVILGLFALIPVRPAKVPETSMNPVYIDLAPPVEEPVGLPQELKSATAKSTGTSGAATAAAASASPATATANPTLASGGAAVAAAKPAPAQAAPQRASPQEAAQAAPPRASPQEAAQGASQPATASQGQGTTRQPSASQGQGAPMAAPTARNPYQGRGGEDPFAPLSESDLAAENPEAPAAQAGLVQQAQRTNTSSTSGSRNAPTEADALAQRVKNTTEGLSERGGSASATGSSGTSTGTSSAAAPASGKTTGSSTAQGGTGAGTLQGALDFGDGPGRRLLSAPPVAIPAKLLEGQPALLETTVRFRIDKGGTVIALSIQFDPPLPMDIAEYLKTYVFSRWVFSSSNSDGQVRFKYSIKVQ